MTWLYRQELHKLQRVRCHDTRKVFQVKVRQVGKVDLGTENRSSIRYIRSRVLRGSRFILRSIHLLFWVSSVVDDESDQIGPRIPNSERVDKAEGRAFLLLLLYKPWRKITQVKRYDQTWSEALAEFENECSKRTKQCNLSFIVRRGDSQTIAISVECRYIVEISPRCGGGG